VVRLIALSVTIALIQLVKLIVISMFSGDLPFFLWRHNVAKHLTGPFLLTRGKPTGLNAI